VLGALYPKSRTPAQWIPLDRISGAFSASQASNCKRETTFASEGIHKSDRLTVNGVDGSRMRKRNLGRILRIAAVLVAFVAITTFGGLLHHHSNPLAAETCPICHAMHLPLSPAPAAPDLPALVRIGRAVSASAPLSSLAPILFAKSSRAPPA
jgi:hypothetical protein